MRLEIITLVLILVVQRIHATSRDFSAEIYANIGKHLDDRTFALLSSSSRYTHHALAPQRDQRIVMKIARHIKEECGEELASMLYRQRFEQSDSGPVPLHKFIYANGNERNCLAAIKKSCDYEIPGIAQKPYSVVVNSIALFNSLGRMSKSCLRIDKAELRNQWPFRAKKHNRFQLSLANDITKYLQLSSSLNDRRLKLLAPILANLKNLRHLDLSDNELTADSVPSIIQILKNNHSLISLVLSDNGIGSQGMEQILNSIDSSSSLIFLYIDNNNLDDSIEESVLRLIRRETNLEDLMMLRNQLSEPVKQRLMQNNQHSQSMDITVYL